MAALQLEMIVFDLTECCCCYCCHHRRSCSVPDSHSTLRTCCCAVSAEEIVEQGIPDIAYCCIPEKIGSKLLCLASYSPALARICSWSNCYLGSSKEFVVLCRRARVLPYS